jgi:plasmid stabilization system protein ParE
MEERTLGKILQLEVSAEFKASRIHIYDSSLEMFGYLQTERYLEKIEKVLNMLPTWYMSHPECRHIPTKSRIYRNIVLDAHLIIYRITEHRIEVLDIVHSASSIGKIRGTREVQVS